MIITICFTNFYFPKDAGTKGQNVWSRRERALAEEEFGELPERADRFTVLMTATLITQDGQCFAVRVRNFSETGLALGCEIPLRIGEAVHVELRDSRVTGHIVRKHGNSYGIRVTGRIDVNSLSKRPVNENAFEVSKLHRQSDNIWRPAVKG